MLARPRRQTAAAMIQVSESDGPGIKSPPSTEDAGTLFLQLYIGNDNAYLEGLP